MTMARQNSEESSSLRNLAPFSLLSHFLPFLSGLFFSPFPSALSTILLPSVPCECLPDHDLLAPHSPLKSFMDAGPSRASSLSSISLSTPTPPLVLTICPRSLKYSSLFSARSA